MERLAELIEDQKEEADADMLSLLEISSASGRLRRRRTTRSAARSAPGDS
jgi:hypothetical protein